MNTVHKISRTAVIGAGACGLIAAKCLLDEGIEPVVFEQSEKIGGLWNYSEDLPDGGSLAYRSLRTNTSKQMMALSDYPFPETLPDFPSRAEVLRYLNDYVDHFGFRECIQLDTMVEQIVPQKENKWKVTVRSTDGAKRVENFDAVIVCSGLYHYPAVPHYPGAEVFQGRMIHSESYKGPENYADKHVVVIGVGSSGVDIAVELSKVAHRVELSTHRGAWFLPHYIGNLPYDHQLTRLSALLPYSVRMYFFRQLVLREYRRLGVSHPLSTLEMPLPEFDVWRTRLTPGSELLKRIANGAIGVHPAVSQLEAGGVIFADGVRVRADTLIHCTGYTFDFPFLDSSLVEVRGDTAELYQHVFQPTLANLAFIGFCIVTGPLWPVAEMQARWVARVLTGAIQLPSPPEMLQAIQRQQKECTRLGAHPMRIQLFEYMEEIAKSIGVHPRLLQHPRRLLRLLTGPLIAAQYRLDGPGRWEHADKSFR
ncbi:MAG TPA: NAD(P)-binding domain-containing protein [Anaerolineales bacterium]|nr:NAD(P)-binding domain-containing protein [Anaerolineales bacterium]